MTIPRNFMSFPLHYLYFKHYSLQLCNFLKFPSQDSEEESGTDFSVFMTVFGYCLLIILLPVLTFFGSKQFFDTFEITSVQSNIWSAVSAVICLHLALGIYLYKGKYS